MGCPKSLESRPKVPIARPVRPASIDMTTTHSEPGAVARPGARNTAATSTKRTRSAELAQDDQPFNVAGATSFGLDGFWFDIADSARSWSSVAERMGLDHRAQPV